MEKRTNSPFPAIDRPVMALVGIVLALVGDAAHDEEVKVVRETMAMGASAWFLCPADDDGSPRTLRRRV